MEFLLVGLLAVAAYTIKGTTGLGSAIVFVGVAALFLSPREVVPVAACLDVAGGTAVMWLSRAQVNGYEKRVLVTLMPGIVIGSLVGAAMLAILPSKPFGIAIGIMVLGGSYLYLRQKLLSAKVIESDSSSTSETQKLVWGGLVSGIFGGSVGIDGPPLAVILGPGRGKAQFRSTITLVLLLADLIRVPTFGALGLLRGPSLMLVAVGVPCAIAGTLLGNRLMTLMSERPFAILVTLLMLISWVELLIHNA